MIHTDPRTAPARTDLPYLRRRTRRVETPIAVPPPVNVSRPVASSSVNVSRPAASSSLDLDVPDAPVAAAAVTPATVATTIDPGVPRATVAAGQRHVLTASDPTVTLSRVQSAIGTLVIDAAVSDAVGDVRLGCAYELRSGVTSTVQASDGNRFAPPDGKRPVLVGGRDRWQRISVDLRQIGELRRFAVYVFSAGRSHLTWGGTLIVTTFSGARIEVPLESMAPGEVAVALSGYPVGGRLVLRAELETVTGSIREACRAYGYDRIAWLDDRTPVG